MDRHAQIYTFLNRFLTVEKCTSHGPQEKQGQNGHGQYRSCCCAFWQGNLPSKTAVVTSNIGQGSLAVLVVTRFAFGSLFYGDTCAVAKICPVTLAMLRTAVHISELELGI